MYAYGAAGTALSAVAADAADAADETKIKNKIRTTDAKAIECILLSVIIILLLGLSFIFHTKKC
jgi:hypothetical protein